MEALVDELGRVGVIAVGALILVQLALQVGALIHLAKTPNERVTLGGRKWAWALIILLGEIAGPIVWFALGRKPAEVADPGAAVAEDTRRSAVDTLYGPKS